MGCLETAHYANIRLFILPIASETIAQRMFCSMKHTQCQVQTSHPKACSLVALLGKEKKEGKKLNDTKNWSKLRKSFERWRNFTIKLSGSVTPLDYVPHFGILIHFMQAPLRIMQILRELSSPVTTKSTIIRPIWGSLRQFGYRKRVTRWSHSESPGPNFSQWFSFSSPPT